MEKKSLLAASPALALAAALFLGCAKSSNPAELVGTWKCRGNINLNGEVVIKEQSLHVLDLLKDGIGVNSFTIDNESQVHAGSFNWRVVGNRLYFFYTDNNRVNLFNYTVSGSTLTLALDSGVAIKYEKHTL